MNRATLVGRVGADPEIRNTNGGGKVANFRIATSERWRDKNSGERKEKTEWHSIVVWGDGLVGIVEQYVNKGDQLLVEGQIQTRKWQDQNGNDRYTTEIVLNGFGSKLMMLGGKREDGSSDPGSPSNGEQSRNDRSQDYMDDEIPF